MIRRSLLASVKHVWSKDPALDREHADFSPDLFESTGDFKYLPKFAGQELTVFELAPLSRKQREMVAQLGRQDRTVEALREAVAFGLRGWARFIGDEGTEIEPRFHTAGGERRATEWTLDQLYDAGLFAELGARIVEISALNPRSGQG